MTDEMKYAVRQMVSGSGADNLERVANLTTEEVTAELGEWSARRVYQLTREAESYQHQLNETNAMIALLTPFVNPNTQVGDFL
jgi:hypothetical protein